MSCSNPILMISTDLSDVDRKQFLFMAQSFRDRKFLVDTRKQIIYKIVSKESRHLPLEKIFEEFGVEGSKSKVLELPCKKCIGCRLDYSLDWANRCSLEAQKYKYNYFITLTYDDNHTLKGELGNDTLSKDDFDSFVRKLRNYYYKQLHFSGIKVFGCGEYGDSTWRPHYHILFFNLPIKDLTDNFPSSIDGSFVRKLDSLGVPMKFSKLISDLWNKGIITIQEFSWNAGAYVSKYILKKQVGQSSVLYDKLGVIPPFLRMSQGIGKDYLMNHKDVLLDNNCLVVGRDHKEPLVTGLPHYYKKILKKEFPDEYDAIIDSCSRYCDNKRSLLKDKQYINDNRAIKEEHLIAHNTFVRNLKEKG